jgi:hypothetical protein
MSDVSSREVLPKTKMANKKHAIVNISMDLIVVDTTVSYRDNLDEEAVNLYREVIDALPPIKVVVVDKTFYLAGGFHRYEAFRKEHKRTIPALLIQGNRNKLIEIAAIDNATHGLPLTKEQRNRAIVDLLRIGKTQEWVGKQFGLSQRTISDIAGKHGVSKQVHPPRKVAETATSATPQPAEEVQQLTTPEEPVSDSVSAVTPPEEPVVEPTPPVAEPTSDATPPQSIIEALATSSSYEEFLKIMPVEQTPLERSETMAPPTEMDTAAKELLNRFLSASQKYYEFLSNLNDDIEFIKRLREDDSRRALGVLWRLMERLVDIYIRNGGYRPHSFGE